MGPKHFNSDDVSGKTVILTLISDRMSNMWEYITEEYQTWKRWKPNTELLLIPPRKGAAVALYGNFCLLHKYLALNK